MFVRHLAVIMTSVNGVTTDTVKDTSKKSPPDSTMDDIVALVVVVVDTPSESTKLWRS